MAFNASHLIELEHETWDALSDAGPALLPYLAEDCIMLFPNGTKVTAKSSPNFEDVMRSEHFVPWTDYKLRDVEVTPLGLTAAIVSYRAKASRGKETEFRALVSTTWRLDEASNKWLMCFHQQSPYE